MQVQTTGYDLTPDSGESPATQEPPTKFCSAWRRFQIIWFGSAIAAERRRIEVDVMRYGGVVTWNRE